MNDEIFTIAICDDDPNMVNLLKDKIYQIFPSKEHKYTLLTFSSGEALLEACEKNDIPTIHLLFLDIEMDQMNGIEVKNALENQSLVKRIIFYTSHNEMMSMAFGAKVIGFIKKSADIEELTKLLEREKEVFDDRKFVLYKVQNEIRSTVIDDILCVLAEKDYSKVYTVGNAQPEFVTKNIKFWEERLKDDRFIRVHKSYLVNLSHVSEMKGRMISIPGIEESIPVGRTYTAHVQSKYTEYLLQEARKRL